MPSGPQYPQHPQHLLLCQYAGDNALCFLGHLSQVPVMYGVASAYISGMQEHIDEVSV